MSGVWNVVKKTKPPINESFWGYDVFYGGVHVCRWDGEDVDDDEVPFPEIEGMGGDDYAIEFWMKMEKKPDPPNINLEDIKDDK